MKNFIKRIIYLYLNRKRKAFNVKIESGTSIDLKNIFEGNNKIYRGNILYSSKIGFGTYIAANSKIAKVSIGRYCSIGSNIQTNIGRHPTDTYISSHPAFFSTKKQAGFTLVSENLFEEHLYVDEKKQYVVEIGNDVWIGNDVMIMDGVKIADGAIVAAGSIVTKNVEPYEIWAGIPAKKIKLRFDENTVNRLLKIEWWNWNAKKIQQESFLFKEIDLFITKHG